MKRSFIATVLTLTLLTGCGTIDKGKLFATLADIAGSVIRYAQEHPEAFIASAHSDSSIHNDATADSE